MSKVEYEPEWVFIFVFLRAGTHDIIYTCPTLLGRQYLSVFPCYASEILFSNLVYVTWCGFIVNASKSNWLGDLMVGMLPPF